MALTIPVTAALEHAKAEQKKATEAALETMWQQAEVQLEDALKSLHGFKAFPGPLTTEEGLADALAHLSLFTGVSVKYLHVVAMRASFSAIDAGCNVAPFDEPTFWQQWEEEISEVGGKSCLTF